MHQAHSSHGEVAGRLPHQTASQGVAGIRPLHRWPAGQLVAGIFRKRLGAGSWSSASMARFTSAVAEA